MKKLKLFVMSLCAMFVAVLGVNAADVECTEDHEAKIGDTCYATFKDALGAVQNNETIVLEKEVKMVSTSDDGNFIRLENAMTIDFNNNTLTISGEKYGGGLRVSSDVTFKNGKIVSAVEPTNRDGSSIDAFAIYLAESSNVTLTNMEVESHRSAISFYGTTNTLTIDANSTVKTSTGAGVVAYENGTYTLNVDGTIINSGTYSAINGAYSSGGKLNVNIGKTGKVSSTKGAAILQMSEGAVTIEGTVEGYEAGIAMTKGNVVVKDGASVSATGPATEFQPSASGKIYPTGAAVYVEPVGDVSVNVKGGSLTSNQGYAISAPKNNDNGVANQKLTLTIENGTFESAKGGIELKDSEGYERPAFISAGAVFLKDGKSDKSVLAYAKEGLDISENGVVGKVSTITVDAKHATVVNPTNAAEGEKVTITVTAEEDYIVKEVLVNGTAATKNADGTYSFVMPNKNVTITVNTEAKPKEVVVEEQATGDKEVTLSKETDDVLKESLANTEDEELQELLKNNDVTVELKATKVEKESLDEEEVAKFENVVKGANVTEFFDLSILVEAAGEEVHYLRELSKPITLTIDLPELPEVATGYARKYYIIREHNGVYEKLDATLVDGKLSFATDKFSTYALAYIDVNKADLADTTELEKAIAEAEKYLDDKKYDAKQVEALRSLIEEAKGLIGADKEGQDTIDAMVEVLKDATTKIANTGDNIVSVIVTSVLSLAVVAGGIVLVKKYKFNN